MAWFIRWNESETTVKCNEITYSNMKAVMDHVEYALKHGYKIHLLCASAGEGGTSSCIWENVMRENVLNACARDEASILEALSKNGEMTAGEIAQLVRTPYQSKSAQSTHIRGKLYRMRDKGLIERVPNRIDSTWRAVRSR